MNEIDLIIGQPFLYNHYTIFNIFDGTIGIYKAYYTQSSREINNGSICCAAFFMSILILGTMGCVRKYNKKTGATKVTVRDKSEKNQ